MNLSQRSNRLLMLAPALTAMAAVAMANEKPELEQVGSATFVRPLKIAAIGADNRRASAWYDYSAIVGTHSNCGTSLCFDAFDPDSTKVPTGGIECGLTAEESRWFFGSTYCNMFSTNDMSVVEKDEDADVLQFAWFWYVSGAGTAEPCYVSISTFQEFDKTCDGPDRGNFLAGIISFFGTLSSSAGLGYYFTDIQLCDAGLTLEKPDGKGAYDMVLANEFDSVNGVLTLATCAQPMLWGTSHPTLGSQGDQNEIQWDDDNPIDGTHTPIDECYDYTFGLCPEPLGSMFCMYSPAACGCGDDCFDLTVPTLVAGSPVTVDITGCLRDRIVTVNYAFESQPGVQGMVGRFCATSKLSPPTGAGVLCQGPCASGSFSCTVTVPLNASGTNLFFQAFGDSTCPDDCQSNLEERTVL